MKTTIHSIIAGVVASLVLTLVPQNAQANVYATDLRINGSLSGPVNSSPGSAVTISYILNEDATAGVTVNILSNETVVRSIPIASGSNGANRGPNSVIWDGKDNSAANVANGVYSISVTAAAVGYTNWTQISSDSDPNLYVYSPRGIAVNRNTNSPYYGRVFIANSTAGPGAETNNVGDVQGILMRNADGTPTADGAFGQAGYAWLDDGGNSPIQIKVKEDDQLYFNDWTGRGKIVACDMQLTTNYVVLDQPNYSLNPFAGTANWINFEVTGAGTPEQRVFLTDAAFPSAGAWMWNTVVNEFGQRVADPDDQIGTQAVATGGSLSLRCDGIAIDANTNVYVIQNRANPGDASMRAAKFANWDGQSTLFSGAEWVVGGGDDSFRNLYGFALDSETDPKILACSMFAAGTVGAHGLLGGGIRLLDVETGAPIYSEPNPFHSILPFSEPFIDQSAEGGSSYAIGAALPGQFNRFGETWEVVNSNSSDSEPMITAGNLSYPNLPAPSGNSVLITPASSGFTGRSGRLSLGGSFSSMYYSFSLKITDVTAVPTSAANNFIAGFSDAVGGQAGTLARTGARLVTRSTGDGGYQIGIGKGSATADYQYDPTPRETNDVLFVVVLYERVGGVTNVNLWVNPDSGTFGTETPPEPTAAIPFGSAAQDLNANAVRSFVLSCQHATAPTAIVDEVRVGRSWSFVTGGQEIGGAPLLVSNLTSTVMYRSVNWDNVGNLYAGSSTLGLWRVFSPPGANEATTVALAPIQIGTAIHITHIGVSSGVVTIDFTGPSADAAAAFSLQSSSSAGGPYTSAAGASIIDISPGVFQATVPASGSAMFYRIER
jgi:hypothetical protein